MIVIENDSMVTSVMCLERQNAFNCSLNCSNWQYFIVGIINEGRPLVYE